MVQDSTSREDIPFNRALRRFDELNSADPNLVEDGGHPEPRELVYARWLTVWVNRLQPAASEALRLAARCQHLCRWMIPRDSYPMTRPGYLKWRADLKKFHAQKAGEVLGECGYDACMIELVQALNLKKKFPADEDSRAIEDALCLVFLEHQLAGLAARTTEEKVLNALQKSWKKMTPKAQDFALELNLPARERDLMRKALTTTSVP